MKAPAILHRLFAPGPAIPGFGERRLDETLRLGRFACIIALPLYAYFIWQDLAILRIDGSLPSRLGSLALFVVAGLVLWWRPRPAWRAYLSYGLAFAGSVVMNCLMVFMVLRHHAVNHVHLTMAVNTLTLGLFACLLCAGGLRRWLPLLAGLPILALIITLAATGLLLPADWPFLSSPLLAFVIVSWIALAQDGERRREAAQSNLLALRLNQLEAILDAITESAFLLDEEYRLVYGNLTMAQRLGHSLSELKARPILDFLPEEVADCRRRILDEVFRTGGARRFEDKRGNIWFDQTVYPVKDDDGKVRYVVVFAKDISDQKRREEKLVFEVLHDPLTGLANRRSLGMRLDQAIARARRGYPSCLLFIDVDQFKEINDQFGHAMGDLVLMAVAAMLVDGSRGHDAVFRIGGDEFAVLVEGVAVKEAARVAERMRATVAARDFTCELGSPAGVSLSIGCTLIDGTAPEDTVIRRADSAMYLAKRSGRNRVELAL